MTAVAAPRSIHSICELARLANCGECWAPPQVPCLRGSKGTRGYHVARFARARRRGLISPEDLMAVLDDVEVFANSTVVYDEVAGVTS
jgi:lipoate synthase